MPVVTIAIHHGRRKPRRPFPKQTKQSVRLPAFRVAFRINPVPLPKLFRGRAQQVQTRWNRHRFRPEIAKILAQQNPPVAIKTDTAPGLSACASRPHAASTVPHVPRVRSADETHKCSPADA